MALAMELSPPQLVLDFEGHDEVLQLAGPTSFFGSFAQRKAQASFAGLRTSKQLPKTAFEATDAFVAAQSERI